MLNFWIQISFVIFLQIPLSNYWCGKLWAKFRRLNICFFQLWPGTIKLIVYLAEQCACIRWRATTSLLFCSRQSISFKALMQPYPGRYLERKKNVFNYRLSLARRVVEKAFGILTQRFRVFLRPIAVRVDVADKIVKASCFYTTF